MTRTVALVVLCGAVIGIGCASGPDDAKPGKPIATTAATSAAPEPSPYTPTPADFTIAITTLSKQCFGSAGCSVTFRIKPAYSGEPLTSSQTFRVIYTVIGDESGAQTNSFTLTGTNVEFQSEESASTKTSKTQLVAKVTEVVAE